jgi:hypothetical protein
VSIGVPDRFTRICSFGSDSSPRARVGPLLFVALLTLSSSCDDTRFRRESPIVQALSDRLEFGATTLGVPVERQVSWVHRGRLDAEVAAVRIEPDDGAFNIAKVPRRIAVRGQVDSTVVYQPRIAGTHRAVLELLLVDGDPVRVVLEGRGVDARAVPQSDVKFGRPAVGAVRNRTLVLRNDYETAVPVTLAFRGADAAEFSGPSDLWIPPFSEASAALVYAPVGRAGPRDVDLQFGACPLCALQLIPVEANAVPVPYTADPNPVDFGAVAVDTERQVAISLTNLTDELITVDRIALHEATDVGFNLETLALPLRLLPSIAESFHVGYSPPHLNNAIGAVIINSDADPLPALTVPLFANGGGSQLLVEPRSANFKTVPVGGRALQTLTVSNGGANAQSAPLTITAVEVSGAPFSLTQTISPGTTLASGASLPLQIAFDPTDAQSYQGTVTVYSDDPISPSVTATLVGSGRLMAECKLAVTPPTLDFGGVLPGRLGELGVRIENVGTDPCTVSNAVVSGDPEFSLTKPRPGIRLEPTDSFVTLVQFRPTTNRPSSGTLTFDTSRQTDPQIIVPLSAASETACLRAEPITLYFGNQRSDCGNLQLTGRWRNTCAFPIDVTSIAFGPGTDDKSFQLVSTSTLPATLPPNATVKATVEMHPDAPGYQVWPLFAKGSDTPLPMLMSVAGQSLMSALHRQSFVQTQPAKLDLLWVVDNTPSMDVNRASLEANVGEFLKTLDARGVDYQIGVTTTGIDPVSATQVKQCPGGARGGEAGRFFPADHSTPRIVTPSTPNRAQVLAQNVAVGGCNMVQQGLRAAWLALVAPNIDNADNPYTPQPADGNLGFFRDDASLAVIVVSNQDDQSPNSVAWYVSALPQVKPKTPMTFSAIVGPPSGCPSAVQPGTRYLEVVKALGGVSASVCASDWSQSLRGIADGLFRSRDTFPLEAPADPASLTVTLNGQATTAWTYDAAKQVLVFQTPPSPGTAIEIDYSEPCPAP